MTIKPTIAAGTEDRWPHLRSSLLLWMGALVTRAYPRLDIETIPDHMKRDLGFLDGRDPRCDPRDGLTR